VHQEVLRIVGHGLSGCLIKKCEDSESFVNGLHLDVHEMLEKLGLTQKVGVAFDGV
jgi:hypothetical protein